MQVGTVRELWRYPFKSMQGERLKASLLGPSGVLGDRGWAVRDETAGEIRGAKKLPALLRCSARYVREPEADTVPAVSITLPDGADCRSDEPGAAQALSRLLGRDVTLWPRRPVAETEHYLRAVPPPGTDLETELRADFGRTPDEPLPDLSVFPAELFQYTSPLGTYFDAFPVHLVSTRWIAFLAGKNPGARFDVRRFRPNFLIEPVAGGGDRPENDWCGRTVRVGQARVAIQVPCPRCVMTTLPQPDLAHDPGVLRTIVRDSEQNVGVYASVVEPGRVAEGDAVVLEG